MRKNKIRNKILYEILDWSKVILTALVIAFVVSHTLIANAQVPETDRGPAGRKDRGR